MFMRQEDRQAINEIRDMIKVLIEENERLANTITSLRKNRKTAGGNKNTKHSTKQFAFPPRNIKLT